jgi:5-methyltetrahydropteroyltriglutamate--homocysteine methyltransferase
MKRSTDRILVSHAGTLPRPDDLREMLAAGKSREAEFQARLPGAIKDVVQKQIETGIDIVNDGEFGKTAGFSGYPRERLSNLDLRSFGPGEGPPPLDVQGRDRRDFPGFAAAGFPARPAGAPTGGSVASRDATRTMVFCTGPIEFIGQELVQSDIRNLKAAVEGQNVEAYLPAVAPGTMEHWLRNEYYKSDEEFLFAIADAMHEEYKAITDAGFILQIDDPDLPDGWQMFPDMTVSEYRKYADLRVEALNHGLRDLPESQIRFHTCWGSQHGPHMADIELRDIVDLVLKVKAECFSLEAGNPRHDTDWLVWEDVKLPDGKSYMPGVVSHVSNHIEHPELVAQRLMKYASLMGKENIIAGTDCGMGSRVGHPEVCWAKFDAMVEGSRLASQRLWGR